ncbi:MAG: oxidoreductase [Bacteroidetes bacterium]|nr:oxidoreductase [Bacteroidota bacterium]
MSAIETKPLIQLRSTAVLSNIEIAPSVFILSFQRDFTFRAGQVLGLGLSANDDPRLYSIASGENDDIIQILYNIKPGGQLTPNLAHLTTGSKLWLTPPFGNYEGSEEPAWWIAAGTGIAPFMSMFRSGIGNNKILIHGSRTLDSFYYSNELSPAMGERYVKCCSGQDGEDVFHGRVTNYLEQAEDLPSGQKYYLCGSAEMVVECREILLRKGVSYNNIVAEIYF